MSDAVVPRARGGQPGNTNAVSHGLYARAKLTAATTELLRASASESLGDAVRGDIDILRVEMARMIVGGEYSPKDLAQLARAVAAHVSVLARVQGPAKDTFMDAVDAVLADVRTLAASS